MNVYKLFFGLLGIVLNGSSLCWAGEEKNSGASLDGGGKSPQISDSYRSPKLTQKFGAIRSKCAEKFIKDDGSYGEIGLMLKKEILGKGKSSQQTEHFFSKSHPQNLDKVCKNYNSMTDDQRLNFWIWTMAAVSKDEGSCNKNAKNPKAGPDGKGIAIGHFQTPISESGGTHPRWRGPGCETPPNFDTEEHQSSCAIEIMGGVLSGKYNPKSKNDPASPFEAGTYWGVMILNGKENMKNRKNNTDTISLVKDFEHCGNPSRPTPYFKKRRK